MAQEPSQLYPPGTSQLKSIVDNYTSLTGSDKWTLQSIMLLVFRPVLHDIRSMVRGGGDRAEGNGRSPPNDIRTQYTVKIA